MKEVECPLGDCDYTGEPKSVEAHISSKTRDGHRGEVGKEYRDELMEDADQEGDINDSETIHSEVSFPMEAEDETNLETEMDSSDSSNDPQAESSEGSEKIEREESKDGDDGDMGTLVMYAVLGVILFAVVKNGSGTPTSNNQVPQLPQK
jgi:hypothetical protein